MGWPVWLLGACAVLIAIPAHPQQRAGDVYVGAALGMTWYPDLEEDTGAFENELRQAGFADFNFSTSTDDRAHAWSVYAGYAVNEAFAVEGGFLGSGKVNMGLDVSGTYDGQRQHLDADGRNRRSSLYGALVGRAPADSVVKPFGKIGLRRWDDEVEGTVTFAAGGIRESSPVSEDDHGYGFLLGVGADVALTEAASFRFEYLYLPLGDDHGGDEHRVQLGMHYTF